MGATESCGKCVKESTSDVEELDGVKVIHQDKGLKENSSFTSTQAPSGVRSRASFCSVTEGDQEDAQGREPNRLTHEQHLQKLDEFFQVWESAPDELEDAVTSKRLILLQRRLKDENARKRPDSPTTGRSCVHLPEI